MAADGTVADGTVADGVGVRAVSSRVLSSVARWRRHITTGMATLTDITLRPITVARACGGAGGTATPGSAVASERQRSAAATACGVNSSRHPRLGMPALDLRA